jgi:hypothetical protein
LNNYDLSQPDGYIEATIGNVTIRLQRTVEGGFTRRVYAGSHTFDNLSAGHTDELLARAECTAIRTRLLAGERAVNVEDAYRHQGNAMFAEIAQILDAAMAEIDVEQVKADLNTDGTAYLAAETEVHNQVVQLRDEVLAESPESYAQWRAGVRNQVVQAAQQATPAREGRTVRNTKTRVFLKPLDPAQIRAIQLHRDVIVHAGNGISWLTLRAIADKNYGTATYVPGRQIIQSVTLNAAGLEVAASTEAAA